MNIRNVLYFLSMAVILVLGFSEDGISIQGDTERLSAYSVFIEEMVTVMILLYLQTDMTWLSVRMPSTWSR
jgi:hypothetical protein